MKGRTRASRDLASANVEKKIWFPLRELTVAGSSRRSTSAAMSSGVSVLRYGAAPCAPIARNTPAAAAAAHSARSLISPWGLQRCHAHDLDLVGGVGELGL